jgi:hypothetical protein
VKFVTKAPLSSYEFHENRCIENRTAFRAYMNFSPYLTHFCPIWMKFGVTGLHIMLLSIGEFHENRRREGRSLVMGVNEITFRRVP